MAVNELLEGEVELWRNASWRVTNMTLEEIADPTVMGPPYWISLDRVFEQDWVRHMSDKNWVNVAEFTEALKWAQQLVSNSKTSGPRSAELVQAFLNEAHGRPVSVDLVPYERASAGDEINR